MRYVGVVAALVLCACFGAPPDVEGSNGSAAEATAGATSSGSSTDASSSESSDPPATSAETTPPSSTEDPPPASSTDVEPATSSSGVETTAMTSTSAACSVVFCAGVGAYGNCLGDDMLCMCGTCAVPETSQFVCAPSCELDCDCEPAATGSAVQRCIDNHCYLDCAGGEVCPDAMQCFVAVAPVGESVCAWPQ